MMVAKMVEMKDVMMVVNLGLSLVVQMVDMKVVKLVLMMVVLMAVL
jgi:hypothetical protein